MRGRERLFERSEGLPADERYKHGKAANQRSNDLGIVGWERRGVYDADQDERCGEDEEKSTGVVELLQGLLEG